MRRIQGGSPTAAGTPQPRDLVRVAFGASLVAVAVIAAITLVQLVVVNSDLTGTLGAVASMWLAVHLVPISIGGQQLGALPLAPAAAMVWATARSAARITPPEGSWFVIRWIVASAVGGPLLLAAVALAVIHDAASVIGELQTPNALRAFAAVAAVHALGALIGVGSRVRPRLVAMLGWPRWATEAVRPAAFGSAALLALSGVVVAMSLVVHWGTMHELFGITDSFVGQLSLTLLSLLYLPNVVLGAAAIAVGSSAHIGFATFSAFTVFGGDIPALPILAAALTPPLGPVWVALLIVGASSGVALGQQCARLPLPLPQALAKLALASLLAALILAVLALAGSGPLGNFGHVGVDQATFGPGVFFWFFVIGGVTVLMAGGVSRRPRRTPPASEPRTVGTRTATAPSGESESAEREAAAEVADESRIGFTLDEAEIESEQQAAPEPASEPASEPVPEPEPEPVAPPPAVKPAPDVEDVEDLMFVDADIEDPAPQSKRGSGGPRPGS